MTRQATLPNTGQPHPRAMVVALVVCGLASVLLITSQTATVGLRSIVVAILAITGQVVLGAFLVRRPVLAMVAAHTLMIVVALALGNAFVSQAFTYLALSYNVGRRRGSTPTWVTAAGVIGSTIPLFLALPHPTSPHEQDWLGVLLTALGTGILLVALPALVGQGMRWQSERLGFLVRLVESERHEAEAATASALRAERTRMARELHDVAAHHMTAVMINAKAARKRAVDASPEVLTFLDEIAGEATRATQSLQQVVGILKEDEDSDADQAPTPSVEDLPELVARAARINKRVRLEMEEEVRAVPTAVGLAAYRIVQESLTNAHRYAPGAPTLVRVRLDGEVLDLVVENQVSAQDSTFTGGTGRGVSGMRSRAVGLGGEFAAGAEDGCWRVSARIPCSPATTSGGNKSEPASDPSAPGG